MIAKSTPPSSALRIPLFRAIWIAGLFTQFGGQIQGVGASWMMTSLSGSPQFVALVQASMTLPIMLLSLWAGAMADNLDRRSVMLWAQGFMLLASTMLSIVAWSGLLTPWLLLGFTFLIGCGSACNGPAWQSSVGDMVPPRLLPGAIALNSMGFNIARSVGPAVGGVIVAAVGAATAFLVNAFSYIGLIAVLLGWRPVPEERSLPREPVFAAMASGMRYVAASRDLRVILARGALFGLSASALPALMPLVARDMLRGGPLIYGDMLGAFGFGAVVGALNNGRLREILSSDTVVRLGCLGVAFGAAGMGTSTVLPVTIAVLIVAGAGWVLTLANLNVLVQMSAARGILGRVLAIYQMAAFGGMAAGSWCFGLLASHLGVGASLIAAATMQLAGVMIGCWLKLPVIESVDLEAEAIALGSGGDIPAAPRSGPV